MTYKEKTGYTRTITSPKDYALERILKKALKTHTAHLILKRPPNLPLPTTD